MHNKTILKNISWLSLQDIPSQIIGIVFYMVLARQWGESILGLYAYIFSVMTIVSLLLDFGFGSFLWRKWSISSDTLHNDLEQLFGARIVLISFVSLGLFFYVYHVDRGWSIFLLLAYVYTLLDSIRMVPVLYFQAKNEFHKVFAINIVDRILPLLLGIGIIFAHGSLLLLFIGFILSRVISLLVAALFFPNLKGFRPQFGHGVTLLKNNFTIFIISLLTFIYFKVDIIMIRHLLDITSVGLYSSAYRIIDSLIVVPTFFIYAAFPTLTNLHNTNNKKHLQELLEGAMKYLSIISVFVAVFFSFYAKEILSFLYKNEYLGAASSLQILGWAVVFYFLTSPLIYSIFSSKKDGVLLFRLVLLTSLNIGLNFVLIPKLGIQGAAISTLTTEVVSFLALFSFARMTLSFGWIAKIALASITLAIGLQTTHYLLFPTLIIGGLVYLSLLYALGVFKGIKMPSTQA